MFRKRGGLWMQGNDVAGVRVCRRQENDRRRSSILTLSKQKISSDKTGKFSK